MREKKKTRLDIHTCVVGSSNNGVCECTAYSWSVLCPSFFPFYVARASSLHIHALPPVVRCYSHFFFYSHAFAHLFFPFSFLSFSLLCAYVCMREHFVLSSLLCDLMVELDVEKSLSLLSFLEQGKDGRRKIACLHNYI